MFSTWVHRTVPPPATSASPEGRTIDPGPQVITGPSQDGTVILGPSRVVSGHRCFGAIVPPGVALEPEDREGWRLVVWHVDPERSAINLWRERRTLRTTLTLAEAYACATLWARHAGDVPLVDDWLRGRVAHSLAAWMAILSAYPETADARIAKLALQHIAMMSTDATELWGRTWREATLTAEDKILMARARHVLDEKGSATRRSRPDVVSGSVRTSRPHA